MAHPCAGAFGDEFSDDEIERLIARLEDVLERRRQDNPNADEADIQADAIDEVTREALKDNLIEARMRRFAALSRRRRDETMAAMDLREDRALSAYNVGSEGVAFGSGASVDARSRALFMEWSGDMIRDLEQAGLMSRLRKPLGGRDKDFERLVTREMARLNGARDMDPTGNREAELAAEILNRGVRRAAEAQNSEGAWIRFMPGYVTRQTHDPIKISGGFWRGGLSENARVKARNDWIADIRSKLDKVTFEASRAERQRRRNLIADGQKASDIDTDGLAAMDDAMLETHVLTRIWTDIVAGRHDGVLGAHDDLDGFRPPPGMARSASASRVLHFKNPDAWFDYNERWGRGSLFEAVDQQMSRGARNAALMRAWGPSPKAAYDAHIARAMDAARTRGDTDAMKGLDRWTREAEFDQLDGSANAPQSVRLASAKRAVLFSQQLSKLGGMVISAQTDTALAVNTLARAGVNAGDAYSHIYRSILSLDGKVRHETADNLNVAARVMMGDITARHNALDGATGVMSRALGVFYRANLFGEWAARLRRGAGFVLARHLGRNAKKGWNDLDVPTQSALTRYAIDAPVWDLLRSGAREVEDLGDLLTLDAARGVDPDAAASAIGLRKGKGGFSDAQRREAMDEVMIRLQAYFNDQVDSAMTEPRARERSLLKFNQTSGTPADFAIGLVMQFKSFPLTVITRQFLPAMRGHGGLNPVATTAHLIATSTMLGLIALQTKMIARGLQPRPLTDDEGNPRLDVMTAALIQGGGLGIFGDLLMADYNRYGQGLADTLGGPAIGELTALAGVLGAMRDGDDPGARAIGFATRNIPFANLFYVKAAMNYLVTHQLQEMASPGYMRRYERRLEREQGVEPLFD